MDTPLHHVCIFTYLRLLYNLLCFHSHRYLQVLSTTWRKFYDERYWVYEMSTLDDVDIRQLCPALIMGLPAVCITDCSGISLEWLHYYIVTLQAWKPTTLHVHNSWRCKVWCKAKMPSRRNFGRIIFWSSHVTACKLRFGIWFDGNFENF